MTIVCWYINPDIEQTGNDYIKANDQNHTDLNQNACKVTTDLTVTTVAYELDDFLAENIHTH